ncbi:MAG: HAD-IA family hydrolase [Akkermansiaceae bacterium]|nr:HAD-IA family hydrolase [Akkermansiaceae bacterium]
MKDDLSPPATPVRALIFDFDGLILDTEVPIYEAWRENYQAHGHDLPLELYVGCVGSDFGRFDPKLHLESLTGERLDWDHWDELREIRALERVNALAEPMPGVRRLLDEAAAAGLPCVVASSSPRSWVETHLERIGLRGAFRFTRCIDDVARPKPAPDLFLAAAAGLGVAPAEALVFEDSLNGLLAAREAGIRCVNVPNPVTAHLDFSGAALVLDSLENVGLAEILDAVSGV